MSLLRKCLSADKTAVFVRINFDPSEYPFESGFRDSIGLTAAAVISGIGLKSSAEKVYFALSGEFGSVKAASDSSGNFKSRAEIDLTSSGEFEASLRFVKSSAGSPPFSSAIPVVVSITDGALDINSALFAYYKNSEQISAKFDICGEEVSFASLLPFAPNSVAERFNSLRLSDLFADDLNLIEERVISYKCDCSRDKTAAAVLSLGKEDLLDLINSGGEIEVNCDFCGALYSFSVQDLNDFLASR